MGAGGFPPGDDGAAAALRIRPGERSSRKIEWRCHEDVALRVLCTNQIPNHATIARLRAEHEEELTALHTQALACMHRLGWDR